MTVQELAQVHQRYVDLSSRFKAAWTFHQFLQGLQKVFPEGSWSHYPADFQVLYVSIKELANTLNAASIDRVQKQIDAVESKLRRVTKAMVQEDTKVGPSRLRQFFQRVKKQDETILLQLVRFYLYSQEGPVWNEDRLDKVDFLLTRLSEVVEEGDTAVALRDRRALQRVLETFPAILDLDLPDEETTGAHRQKVEAVRGEIRAVESFDDLNDNQIVQRYRRLKRGLGSLFFVPPILLAILETNLALKNCVRRLYNLEQRRLADESQRLFDLEREATVDSSLDAEMEQFRAQIDRFEKRVQQDNIRLDELAQVRDQLRALMPRLSAVADVSTQETEAMALPQEPTGDEEPESLLAGDERILREELLGDYFRQVLDTLGATDPQASERTVVLSREVYALRLEPREVVAYRRLTAQDSASQEGIDLGLERFLLEAAAARVRINEDASEINSILDDTTVTRDGPVFRRARRTLAFAGHYLERFSHLVHEAVLANPPSEASGLLVLKMRLMRDYSGLWLLVHRE